MQFDVYSNPDLRARKAYPFLAILQSNFAETGADRIVAFLAPRVLLPDAVGRVAPIVAVGDDEFVLMLSRLTNTSARSLQKPIGSISGHREAIVGALDWLFLGI